MLQGQSRIAKKPEGGSRYGLCCITAGRLLLADVHRDLKVNRINGWQFRNGPRHTDLKRATNTTSETYRQATVEALSYLHWVCRFAEAVLPEPEEGEE